MSTSNIRKEDFLVEIMIKKKRRIIELNFNRKLSMIDVKIGKKNRNDKEVD